MKGPAILWWGYGVMVTQGIWGAQSRFKSDTFNQFHSSHYSSWLCCVCDFLLCWCGLWNTTNNDERACFQCSSSVKIHGQMLQEWFRERVKINSLALLCCHEIERGSSWFSTCFHWLCLVLNQWAGKIPAAARPLSLTALPTLMTILSQLHQKDKAITWGCSSTGWAIVF